MKNTLENLKYEVAKELNITLKGYNGDLPSSQCGKIGGQMVKKMINSYKKKEKY